jgi:superfamily I DNA/RNA helicase
VSLLSLHAALGLEFPVVFVVGVVVGLSPFSWGAAESETSADDVRLAVERRLFFVAMTRAKDRLFLTRARERAWRGQRRALPPSPFLDALAPELLRVQDAPPRRVRDAQRQISLF